MIEKFIITTDLSPVSYAIVNCIGSLRELGANDCLLLQCLSQQEMASLALSYTTAPLENMLNEQRQTLEKHGFTVTARIVSSNLKQEVNHIAEKENYSLIVLGYSRSTVRDTFLGGIAYNVVHHARKPALVIPVEIKDYEDVCTRFVDLGKHILYPTDFSENADLAFNFVEEFVSRGAKHVTLLHVQDKPRLEPYLKDRIEEFNRIDRERLQLLSESLKRRGSPVIDIELAYGSPYTEIIKLIRTRDISLVLMGSQGRGFVQELFLGSVSHNVVQNSEAPVMLIPAKR